MGELVRFGVAMDRGLLEEFDRRIAARGYENRSEALRDLVRADLTRAAWDRGARVAGTLTVVFGKKHRAEVAQKLDAEGAGVVVATTRIDLDDERALEVVVLRGRAAELSELAGRVGSTRGVLAAELAIATTEGAR